MDYSFCTVQGCTPLRDSELPSQWCWHMQHTYPPPDALSFCLCCLRYFTLPHKKPAGLLVKASL